MSKRDTLASNLPAADLKQTLNHAATLMTQQKKSVMTAEILLLAFLETSSCQACQMLRHFSREIGFDWADFERDVIRLAYDRRAGRDIRFDFVTSNQRPVPLSNEILIVLDEALALANLQHEKQCDTGHALAAMAHESVGTVWALQKYGLNQPTILAELGLVSQPTPVNPTPVNHQPPATRRPVVSKPTSNRPARPTPASKPTPQTDQPVYHREALLADLISRLSILQGRHVILLGESGVGKRSLVLSLAQRIAQDKGPLGLQRIIQVDEIGLLNDAATEITSGIQQAQGGILFVPDIGRFFGGLRADFPEEAGNALQKAFLSENVVVIGTTTEASYEKSLRPVAVVTKNSQILRVSPATTTETVNILQTLRPKFEADYQLTIQEPSLSETVRLAARYYTGQPLPGAAVYLLHRACALVRTNQTVTKNSLAPEDVLVAASLVTGVPMSHMGADERNRYLNMVEHLHHRIVGQDEAVVALSRAVKMARVGLKEPARPIGSFLFVGPTGVGKTELAKALAEFMFGTENALIVLDMSEYMEDSAINRLIGSPPGYIGHEAGGQLTDAVKQRPHSVILFDEVEKASVKVFDTLLQVMEEGRLTSSRGETVNFNQCVILMTSNIGGRYFAETTIDDVWARQAAEEELREHFRPEFLNRLDDIIYFHPLTDQQLAIILDLLLNKEQQLLANRALHLTIDDAAKTWLLQRNENPEWGARPLRRLIQKHLREPLADYILQHDPSAETTLKVSVTEDELFFEEVTHHDNSS